MAVYFTENRISWVYVQSLGPKEANVLRIELPEGWMLHGPIIAGVNEPGGGWLEFSIEQHDMDLASPVARDGWEWQ